MRSGWACSAVVRGLRCPVGCGLWCCATAQASDVLHRPIELAQYTSVRFGETLMLAGLTPSIGSVGDAYDNDEAR